MNTQLEQDISLAKEIVTFEGAYFYISTINRESSAELSYRSHYAETIVWEWYPKKEGDKRGKIVGQDEAAEGSLVGHKRMVHQFKNFGAQYD